MKISIHEKVVPIFPIIGKSTLREILIALGANLPGLTTDRGFSINGQQYAVDRATTPDSRLSWTADTNSRLITIYNPKSEDEVHRIMFAALLQYTPERADSEFYKYTVNLRRRLQELDWAA